VEILKAMVLDLRKQGKTILFSSHRMDHVEELCEKICIMHKSNTVLQGNLREIKGTFPKERILLDTTSPVSGLEQINGVVAVKKLESSGYEIQISDIKAAEPVLVLAMQQASILRYQIMEPTLNEIFIKKVGNNHE
jgi:ABC-2 type transport system ATP-binding protein